MYQTCHLDLIREISLERLQWPASLVLEFLLACALSVMCQGWEQNWAERCISCVYLFENQTSNTKYQNISKSTPSISRFWEPAKPLWFLWFVRLRLPRSTGIDSARGLSCGLLFLVGQAVGKHGKTWKDLERLASFPVTLTSVRWPLLSSWLEWPVRPALTETVTASLEQFEHKDVPVKPIKLKIAQCWESPQDSQDPARKRLWFYWFYGFHVELSMQRRSWRNPRNLRALKVLVLLLRSGPSVTSGIWCQDYNFNVAWTEQVKWSRR